MRLVNSGIMIVALALGLCTAMRAQGDLLRRGLSLIKAQRPAEAEQVLGLIPASDGDYHSAQTLLGYLFLQRSALPQAERAFRTVLDAHVDIAQARLGLGATLLKNGSAERASVELAKILEDPEVGFHAQIQWIYSLLYAGRTDEAFRQAQSLAAGYDSAAAIHSILGYLHQIRSEPQAALQEYLQAVQLDPDNESTYLDLISAYKNQGDWDHALSYTKQALLLDSNDPLLYQNLAAIYQKLGATAEANAARSQAERAFDAEVLYAQAARSRAAGRIREAEGFLRESTKKNPKLSKAWSDLGELMLQGDRLEEARTAFLHAVESTPGEARAVAGLAATLHAEGKDSEALRYCQEAMKQGLVTPDVLAAMATIYMDQGLAQDAAEVMTQAVRQLPDNPDLLSYLGYLQQSMGKAQEARESFAAALRLNPRQVDALIGQAHSLLASEQTRDALASFNLARTIAPRNTEIWKGLIEAYGKSGDLKSAEASCRECLAISAKDLDCREQLAAFRMEDLDFKDAAGQYQIILRSGKSSKSILDGFAYSLMKIGDYDRAVEFSERSIRQYGPDARVYGVLGYLYRCRGDLTRAVSNYRLARDAEPLDPERSFDFGLALYLAGDFAGAAAPIQTAIRLKPDYGTAHYYLAIVYWNLRQYALALTHARRAQDLGVPAANAIIQSLTPNLSLPTSKKFR
jgi:tetratricopeptide (TPR) repeat protein